MVERANERSLSWIAGMALVSLAVTGCTAGQIERTSASPWAGGDPGATGSGGTPAGSGGDGGAATTSGTPGDTTLGLPDADGDGVPDVVESAAATDPADASSNPWSSGDLYFAEPPCGPPAPARSPIVFATTLKHADVYFMIDNSWSMQGIIDSVRDTLTGTIFPGLTSAIEDVQIGAGAFDVCPEQVNDTSTALRPPGGCIGIADAQASTGDVSSVVSALGSMTADCGTAEPYGQAAWLFATGDTSHWPLLSPSSCPASTTGYGCTRTDSLPVLVIIGDEPYSEGTRCGTSREVGSSAFIPSVDDVGAALAGIGAKLIVIGPSATSPEWTQIAMRTGSIDASGAPLLFAATDVWTPGGGGFGTRTSGGGGSSGSSTALGDEIVGAVQHLAQQTPLDITARVRDLDDDGIDATTLIDHVEADTSGGVADPRDPSRVCVALPAVDSNGDGVLDTFPGVAPGTPVCFDVVPAVNTTVPPTAEPQVVRAAIDIVAGGVTTLDTRTVYFLIPPASADSPACNACTDSSQCPGEFCEAGRCVPGCTDSSQCPGEFCEAGRCVPGCSADRDCASGQTCMSGSCVGAGPI